MLESMLALAAATIILGFSPGPAVFATIGRSLGQGLKPTYLFILGITLGDLIFSLMAMLGLAALAAAYTPFFFALKILGGGYFVYLGINSWRDSAKPDLNLDFKESGWKLVTSGLLLTASNPKDLLFFIGFVPLFVNLQQPVPLEIITASCVIVAAFLVTFSFYAILASAARKWFKSEKSIQCLHRVAGVLMIAAGLAVMFS